MPLVNLTPAQEDVGDLHFDVRPLITMIASALRMQHDLSISFRASRIYFGFVVAFQQAGILDIAHAPDLIVDVEDTEYRILIGPNRNDRHSIDARNHSTDFKPRVTLNHRLLEALAEWPEDERENGRPEDGRENGQPGQVMEAPVPSVPHKGGSLTSHWGSLAPAASHLTRLTCCIQRIDWLENRHTSLSVTTNWAYYDTGRAYADYSRAHGVEISQNRKTDQARVFKLLCEFLVAAGIPEFERKESALRKRLQRARKFAFVVNIFGTWTLNAVPHLTVTPLDAVSFKQLLGTTARYLDGRLD